MRRQTVLQFIFLFLVCAHLLSPTSRAQSSRPSGSSCAPTVSCDEFKELIGKKVYPKIMVDEVTFDGPMHLPLSALAELESRIIHHEFDSDPNWLENLVEGPIRGVWQDHGYFMAKASGRAIPHGGDPSHQHFSVIIHVDEGLLYRTGEITLRSANPDETLVFPSEELRNLIPLREGEVLSPDKIRTGLDNLRNLYGAQGFIDFTATPFISVDEVTQLVSLRIELDQHKQYRVGGIIVSGLNRKLEELLRSQIRSGDVFNMQLIETFLKDNKSVLPQLASPEEIVVRRDERNATVDLQFCFRN